SIATRCTVRCVPTGRGLSTCAGGVTWALPLYELALLTARYARDHHIDADIAIVTPEHAPHDIFGPHASGLVRDLLAARDVRFLGARHPERFDRDGHLHLRFEAAALPADRVIAAPRMVGRAIPGIRAAGTASCPPTNAATSRAWTASTPPT
ncbi:MAG: sulfide:quinone oxidoreductase, partial [Solirubrobacteraceae bacterium]|nr:sulfide:quinone oxidoreductase [Solirubrobacteraceae bacterium]